jgi:hypothetical protein
LPTITEDNVDDEVVDSARLGLIKKKVSVGHQIPKSVRNSQNYNKEQLLKVKEQMKEHRRQASNLVGGLPPSREGKSLANPRSVDIYSYKAKA